MVLSFVVPAYNEEAYIGPCLESILEQTRGLEHLTEIIVVNNASTDRTRDIALSYPGVLLVDEPRKGLTFARQAGFAASTGSLIANVDADSRLTPGWVSHVLSTFAAADAKSVTANQQPRVIPSEAKVPLHPPPHQTPRQLATEQELVILSEAKDLLHPQPHQTPQPSIVPPRPRKDVKPLAALSGPVLYYDLTPRQRLLVHVFYLTAWTTYAINRYLLRVGSMVQGGNFVTSRVALEAIGGFNTAISFYGEDTDIARRLNAVGEVRFTFDLKMFSSARRLKSEGLLTMAWRYGINYLWTTFFHRPYTDEYIDIRETLPTPQPEA